MASQSLRKSNKSRRETAVQGTNDSSIVSKCSTAASGYFEDLYLKFFVSKTSRRAPLIHRGYYIRAYVFDRILKNFLLSHQKYNKKQIISLGCGFDSTYFRLKANGLLKDTTFYEIDFPEVVQRKRLLIENTTELNVYIDKLNDVSPSPHIELSCDNYYLLGIDLTQLNTLEAALKMCGADFECPTILFSECVMTYLTRRCSTEVIKWAAETFESAVFAMYEQVNPDDAFGMFMQHHFNSIGSPLRCINAFPTVEDQISRFTKAGWTRCEAMNMNQFYYNHVPSDEQKRIEQLEAFDEYEELNLKFSHYFVLTAFASSQAGGLLTNGDELSCSEHCLSQHNKCTWSRLKPEDEMIRRFGHSSSLVRDRYILTCGGFGELDGRHQRLSEMTVTDTNSLLSFHVPCSSNSIQYARMHHSSISLSDGSTLLVGGRQSPYFMCNQMLKIFLTINEDSIHACDDFGNINPLKSSNIDSTNSTIQQVAVPEQGITTNDSQNSTAVCSNFEKWDFSFGFVTVTVVQEKGSVPQERWRHAVIAVSVNGDEYVFLHGGKRSNGDVLNDEFLFNPTTNTWFQLDCTGDKPGARHSHCAVYWQGKVILSGGLDSNQKPVNFIHCLDLNNNVWQKINISGILHPRYSHTCHVVDEKLYLVGGVNLLHPPPGLAVISLDKLYAEEYALPEPDERSLLMLHRHTSVLLSDSKIVVLGGGGNCFSFGTHLNKSPLLIHV